MKPRQTEMALVLLLLAALGMAQQMCLSPGFPPMEQFQLEDVKYIQSKTDRRVGYLVIVPEMRFNCHGYITGWNALTRLNSTEAAINNLIHDITFQLWRPSARGSGTYDFIGSRTLDFDAGMLQNGLKTVNGTQFFNFTSVEQNGEQLYFQPGDVIGWYIHSTVQSTEVPLTVVYRQSSSNNGPGLRPVDMYSAVINDTAQARTQPPCEVSLESSQLNLIPSVIPYVTVLVSSTTPDQPQPESIGIMTLCDKTANLSPIVIETTTTAVNTRAPPPKNLTDYDHPHIDLVSVAAGTVASLVLIAVVSNILIVLCMEKKARKKKRARRLNGTNKITEAADEIRPQDVNDEPRYVANPHQNEDEVSNYEHIKEVYRTVVTTGNAVHDSGM